MKNKLSVLVNFKKAGKLWLDAQERFFFQYSDSWLNCPGKQRLSISLPLQSTPFENDAAYPYFTNLLPEGKILSVLSRKLGISDNDYFGLLRAIGGDCAGAVSLYPESKIPTQNPKDTYEPLTQKHLLKKLTDLKTNPFLAIEERRLSLAGAQEKLPVFIKDGQVLLPVDGAPSSHIIKTPIEGLQGTVTNETYCMILARKMGLDVPDVHIQRIGGLSVFVVARYDRTLKNDQITRLIQEDFCQALKINCTRKYEPNLKDCFQLIRQECADSISDSRKLLRLFIFNGLIGNADGHAKNISLIHDKNGTHLAPFYDLLSTLIYRDFSKKMPGKIANKKREFLHLKQKHFQALGEEISLPPKLIIATAIDMSKKIIGVSKEANNEFKSLYKSVSIVDKINKIIENNSRQIINELSA